MVGDIAGGLGTEVPQRGRAVESDGSAGTATSLASAPTILNDVNRCNSGYQQPGPPLAVGQEPSWKMCILSADVWKTICLPPSSHAAFRRPLKTQPLTLHLVIKSAQ